MTWMATRAWRLIRVAAVKALQGRRRVDAGRRRSIAESEPDRAVRQVLAGAAPMRRARWQLEHSG
jgi:hypothetical protein